MPRGNSHSEHEQGLIIGMHQSGSKNIEIARKLNRHKNTICNFLKNPSGYGTTPRSGRKTVIDTRCKRQIQRLAAVDSLSSGQIKAQLGLFQIIHENPSLSWCSSVVSYTAMSGPFNRIMRQYTVQS
ncbi:hypothetical protein ACLKA6_015881 [Drosophila palustris]